MLDAMMPSRLVARSPRAGDAALLVLRLSFGLAMALGHGLGKVSDLGGFTAKVAKLGLPAAGLLGPAAALSELVGGLLIAVGLLARPSALALLGTMLVAAFVVHASDPFARKELALAYAVVSLVVLIAGPGRFSADARLFGKPAE